MHILFEQSLWKNKNRIAGPEKPENSIQQKIVYWREEEEREQRKKIMILAVNENYSILLKSKICYISCIVHTPDENTQKHFMRFSSSIIDCRWDER